MSLDRTDPVQVVHLITDLEVGGAEVVLARLLSRLDRSLVRSVVVTLRGRGPIAAQIERDGHQVFTAGISGVADSPLRLLRLVRLIRRLRPDVLNTWLYHADLVGLIAAKLSGVRSLAWNIRCAELNSRDHSRSLMLLRKALAAASGATSLVICNSFAGQRAHEDLGYRPPRWLVIPNGFDTEGFRPDESARRALRHELALPDDAVLVGLLGRFHAMKDHPTFIRAAQLVAAVEPNIRFIAAGRGVAESPELTGMIDSLGLGNVVHLAGERADAPRFLAALDIAVSSSYGEAFPNVVGEAMACGTPCVVTDVGDSAAIVGDTGVIVRPSDPEALARGILQLLQLERTEREALGRQGRNRIMSGFGLEQMTRRYEQVYRELAVGAAVTPRESPCAG